MRPSLAALLLSLPLAACLEDLPSPSVVDDLRVLAVKAEPAEAAPGDSVTLEALVVDPLARPPRYAWYACVVVEQGQGFFGGGSETSSSGGDGTPLSTDPYGGSCQKRFEAGERFAQSLGDQPTATLVIPADFLDDDEALRTAYDLPEDLEIPALVKQSFLGIAGVNYTVTLVVEVDGRRIETQKRVNVSLPSTLEDNDPNTNPADLAFHVARAGADVTPPTEAPAPDDGRCFAEGAPPIVAGQRFTLTPLNVPDPQPRYVVLLAGTTTDQPFDVQTVDETLFYSWFSTAGSLKKPISKVPGQPFNEWAFDPDDAGLAELWIVVRDGRGGTAWCYQPVTVLPPGGAP